MTRRSITNERNIGDGPEGVAKKSAAKAKPASKAAASVYVKDPNRKLTRKERKALEQKQAAKKQKKASLGKTGAADAALLDAKAREKEETKPWRIRWGVAIGVAVLAIVGSFFWVNNAPFYIAALVVAYAGLIFALWIEFGKIRKIRKKYQPGGSGVQKMTPKKMKHQAEQQAAYEAEKVEKSRRGGVFSRSKKGEDTEDLPFADD